MWRWNWEDVNDVHRWSIARHFFAGAVLKLRQEWSNEMRKKWVASVMILLGIISCAHMGGREEKEKIYGNNPPVIEQSFASDRLNIGDLWKIYFLASDPDGDMETIIAVVEQVGRASYPVSLTKIKEENGKELSGYVYLTTKGYDFLYDQELTVSLQIRDKAGHISKPVTHSVAFLSRQTPKSPPEGVFKEKDLGPIMVILRPVRGRR